MQAHLIRLPLAVAVVALLSGLAVEPAQGGKKAANAVAYAPIIAELHHTRVLLHEANHDYDGFRAKAMHDIGKAMHALDPNHSHKLPKAGVAAVHEDQTISDKQLHHAQAAARGPEPAHERPGHSAHDQCGSASPGRHRTSQYGAQDSVNRKPAGESSSLRG